MFENNMENIEVIGIEEDIKRKVFPKIFTGSFKVNIKDLNFSSPIWKICKKTNGYKIDKNNTFFVFCILFFLHLRDNRTFVLICK